MRVLLFVIFVTNLAWGYVDIFTKYRSGESWEQDVDKYLYSDDYANKLLENKNVTFGYYDNPTNIILCNKSKRVLKVYKYNGLLELDKTFKHILTGKNNGDKWNEGDGKTPIGVYTLKYKIDDNNLSDFYGPLAYPTSYPNLYDTYRGKSGHGIWIHGFPKDDPERNFDTKGCIALPNNELINLSKTINYQNSILIIDTDNLPTTNKEKIATIIKDIFRWRYAWKYNQLNTYLSFYDKKNFKKENKYGFKTFKERKKIIFQNQKHKRIKFKNLQIIPYPSKDKNLYKVTFYETFDSGRHHFEYEKVLYLKLINGKISIFLEN